MSVTRAQSALLLIGLTISLAACSGQVVPGTATPFFLDTVVPSPIIAPSATPNCTATDRAKQAVQGFFSAYNAGQMDPVLARLAPNFREYLDTFDGFMVIGDHLPDIRTHFQQMFALHDQLTAADGDFQISVEPPGGLPEYYVLVSNVERTNDKLKASGKTQHGRIQMGVYCDTLQLGIIGIMIVG